MVLQRVCRKQILCSYIHTTTGYVNRSHRNSGLLDYIFVNYMATSTIKNILYRRLPPDSHFQTVRLKIIPYLTVLHAVNMMT